MKVRKKSEAHRMSFTNEYRIWAGMINRCSNQNDPGFKHYGGRGIAVCKRWRNSFLDFLEDMGRRPKGRSIDRINNDGNYEPGNCRWATPKQQASNKRTSNPYLNAELPPMLKSEAIKRFGTGYRIAKLLGVSRQYVYQWPDVVPIKCARELERISEGKLKVKVRLYNGAQS